MTRYTIIMGLTVLIVVASIVYAWPTHSGFCDQTDKGSIANVLHCR